MRFARFAAFFLLVAPVVVSAEEKFYLKDGDRVVFYGDSITDQRLYTTFAETYVVTRFPKMNVTFVHSGWGGDRVGGGGGGPVDVRLQRDVLAYKPTVMTIMLGMNDASYRAFDEKIFDVFARGMQHIVDKVKAEAPGVRITLIQPSPFDDVTRPPAFEGGYNKVLVQYGQYLKALAREKKLDVADLNTSVVEATKKAYESDPENSKKLNGDRVHPGPGGQLLMAAALLEAWNAPAIVTDVRIKNDCEQPKAEAKQTKVSGLGCKEGTLSWTQNDEALPFPINLNDPIVALAVKSSDVVKDLDQELLQVDGLDKDKYTLKIDGKEIGTYSKDELAKGINLATLPTPMNDQAMNVHRLTLKHGDLHNTRWRNIQVPLQDIKTDEMKKALDAIDAIEAVVIAEQRAAAEPKPHKYELAPKS